MYLQQRQEGLIAAHARIGPDLSTFNPCSAQGLLRLFTNLCCPSHPQDIVLPMAVEHIYERDLVALTARGFWAISMSRSPISRSTRPAAAPATEQLAAAFARRLQKRGSSAGASSSNRSSQGGGERPQHASHGGLQGSLQTLKRDLQTAARYVLAG